MRELASASGDDVNHDPLWIFLVDPRVNVKAGSGASSGTNSRERTRTRTSSGTNSGGKLEAEQAAGPTAASVLEVELTAASLLTISGEGRPIGQYLMLSTALAFFTLRL
jgi:hypothetical protein